MNIVIYHLKPDENGIKRPCKPAQVYICDNLHQLVKHVVKAGELNKTFAEVTEVMGYADGGSTKLLLEVLEEVFYLHDMSFNVK